jgi:hypothetical protein
MKTLIFLSILVIAAESATRDQPVPFKNIFNAVRQSMASSHESEDVRILRAANFSCIEEKIKLNRIGEKVMHYKVGVFVITWAGMVCIEDSPLHLASIFEGHLKAAPRSDDVLCLKEKLKTIDPNSHIVQDHQSDGRKADCIAPAVEAFIEAKRTKILNKIKFWGFEGCFDQRSHDHTTKSAYKFAILAITEDEERIKQERIEFLNNKEHFERAINCVVKKIEEN